MGPAVSSVTKITKMSCGYRRQYRQAAGAAAAKTDLAFKSRAITATLAA
jgi:hypothetical protein